MNRQLGPDASILAELVAHLTYKPSWSFELKEVDRGQGCHGLTLLIGAALTDSTDPAGQVDVLHLMPVPAAAYDRFSWERWLLEQVLLVERHEALELFRIDGEALFFPEHRPGVDPYRVVRVGELKSRADVDAPALVWHGLLADYGS